tara:strand:- start:49 stop:768 length:720 start_codon:yes stop_codon:yes gene_type:complete
MKKEKKIKIILALTYIIAIAAFLWVFFNNFSLEEISNYGFIKNNFEYFEKIRENNFFLVSLIFFVFTILWVLLLGFGTPVVLLAGFLFGKWIGSIYGAFALTLGSTLLYVLANFFLKDLIEEKFYKRFSNLSDKFKKNEFNFFIIYRFIGGIPFFISNILPTIFNIKVKNFFFGSLFGMYPQIFIWASLGSGISELISNNSSPPTIKSIILSSEIYIPIIAFIIFIFICIMLKNIFYKE